MEAQDGFRQGGAGAAAAKALNPDISAIGGLAMTSTSALGDDSTSFTVTRR